jgi:hypothetical protein
MKTTSTQVFAKIIFVGWTSTGSRRIISFHDFLSFMIMLGNILNNRKKCGYGKFNHRYNVSPIHKHAVLGVEDFTKVVSVCAESLWSGARLPKVCETLL